MNSGNRCSTGFRCSCVSAKFRSRRTRYRLGERQAPQIVGRSLCFARCGKECSLVRFQKLNPACDVTRMAQIIVEAEFGAKERRSKLGNKLLRSILPIAEPIAQITIEPGLMASPMPELVERHIVEAVGRLERGERRQAHVVIAWPVVGLAEAFPDVCPA